MFAETGQRGLDGDWKLILREANEYKGSPGKLFFFFFGCRGFPPLAFPSGRGSVEVPIPT